MKQQTLSLAIALAIAAGFLPWQQAVAQQNDEEEAEQPEGSDVATLDRIEVTGSRIKRSDIEAALPVAVIDREDIELSGEISTADLIRNTSFNSFGSYRSQSGSSDSGTQQVSLRGLGASRTLVLVDGRRAAKGGNTTGVVNDLSHIPLAAVERIEILSDGASALYGSDAIGGVINVITRRDFDGVELRIGAGYPTREGGDTEEASVVFGASGERGRLLAGASYNFKDIVFQRQRDYASSTLGDGVNFSTVSATWSPFGNTYQRLDTGEYVAGNCDLPNFRSWTNDLYPGGGEICAYDYTQVGAYDSSSKNTSLFVKGDYLINDDWEVYSRATAARVETFGRYAPAPVALLVPAGTANNPLGVDALLYHRFAALGNRDNTVETQAYDYLLGMQGRLGAVDLDFGLRHANNRTNNIGRNYVVNPVALQYLADGTYDASNPFDNPEDVLNSMKATTARVSEFKQNEVYALLSGYLWDMGGGEVGYSIGAEYRTENYADQYDSLSEAGAIGGSAGNSAGGSRQVASAYGEVLFPLASSFDVTVAGRFDRYSDYGNDFSPKIALRWQPLESLTLRGSIGEGFAAPSLDILTQKESTSAPNVQDLVSCERLDLDPCPTFQATERRRSNPNLESENSLQWSAGLAWQPLDWFDMTLDYYDITVENRIAFYGAQTLLNREFQGIPAPPGLGVVRNAAGSIVEILTGFGNEGEVETTGADLNFNTNFDLGDAGRLRNSLRYSHVFKYEIDGTEFIDTNGAPSWRATLTNDWTLGDFTAAWNVNAVGSNESADGTYILPTYVTHDAQVSWELPWNAKAVVGVRNVANKLGPVDLADPSSRNMNYLLYDVYGRVPYFRYEQRF